MDDQELLDAYVRNGSETAFQQLVERHLGLVHSMAMRQTGDTHLAQDVAQAVFVILVRKAGSLPRRTVLAGWFFKTTRFVARTALRTERRRQQREMTAMIDTASDGGPDAVWEQVQPHLDAGLASLGEKDRLWSVLSARASGRRPGTRTFRFGLCSLVGAVTMLGHFLKK